VQRMRYLDIDSYRNDHDRFGACHRCGWTQHLEKVNHSRRGMLHADRTCRWVCAECIHDLSASAPIHVPSGFGIGNDHAKHHRSAA